MTCPTCPPTLSAAAVLARSLRFGWPPGVAEREIRESLVGFHAVRVLVGWRWADA